MVRTRIQLAAAHPVVSCACTACVAACYEQGIDDDLDKHEGTEGSGGGP